MSGNDTTLVATEYATWEDGRIHGWVDQPSSRGTFDIAWNCLFTIFICTFTMLCLNVPSNDESSWDIMKRRLYWMAVAISGPEFVLTYASGQWGTARDSVRAFKASNYPQWTMRHGFFADMGGFHLASPDTTPFPITSRHIHWLVCHGHMDIPDATTTEIDDKSKQDTVAKVVTCFQISYLILQCIGRAVQRLTITTMELSALGIVICSMMTSMCWWCKPADVRTPIKLHLREGMTLDKIRQEVGGTALKEWEQTPLDFIDDLKPSWALNVQTFMKMPVSPFARPIPRLGNDRFPNLRGEQESILCVGTLLYAAIHLFGWNYEFPTYTELLLWRISSMFLFANTVAFWVCETASVWWRVGRLQRWFCKIFWRSKLEDVERSFRGKQTSGKPKQLPLKGEFWSIFPLAWTYAAARLYLIVEAFLGLRAMDPTAFMNVEWANYIPHF